MAQILARNEALTRWWWLGSAVDKPNLKRLLHEYSLVGLGGVEITPIYGVKGNDANNIPYLSPKWIEMLQYALAEAAHLGLGVDMPTGTGWPFGGPQMTDSGTKFDRYSVENVKFDPGKEVRISTDKGKIEAITANTEDGEFQILTSKLGSDGRLDWMPHWENMVAQYFEKSMERNESKTRCSRRRGALHKSVFKRIVRRISF